MSVADRFEQELVERLRELRPLAVEYRQLEQVARRLGLALDDDRAAPSRAQTTSISGTEVPRISTLAASRGVSWKDSAPMPSDPLSSATRERKHDMTRRLRREQEVLRLSRERPGLTVRQIAEELNVDATNLYRHVRKLEENGAITKLGTALYPGKR